MNLERATGLVLRTRPVTETSLIVNWLTRESGRIATVARGARRPKSPFRGQLDLFYLVEFSYARSNRSDLHALREARLLDSHAHLRVELGWLRQASSCIRLVEQTTECEAPIPAIFDLLLGLFRQLPLQPPMRETGFAFELKLLHELGLQPPLAGTSLSPGARKVLEQWLNLRWPDLVRLRVSPAQLKEIQTFLSAFIFLQFGPRKI